MTLLASVYDVTGYTDPKLPTIFGIECEVESVRDFSTPWHVTEDGSLRHTGREFISPPMQKELAVMGFQHLHAHLEYSPAHEPFSERTSIHVHVNCQNLDTTVIRNTIFMYALFEEFFFSMTKPDRRNNIHCVPLTETHLPGLYRMSLENLVGRWHKYTALNIKPLSKYGTIEFRHMHGHNDTELFAEWIAVLDRLFQLGKSADGQITRDSISNRNLEQWFDALFAGTRVQNLKPMLRELTQNQRLDIKLMLLGS